MASCPSWGQQSERGLFLGQEVATPLFSKMFVFLQLSIFSRSENCVPEKDVSQHISYPTLSE